jgi:AcrR family transcriptional regulator
MVIESSARSTQVRRGRPTRAERRAETRSRLLDAAVEVCARRGLHGAGVEEIAERAGYSTGAIYSNFHGKDDLLLAVFEHRLEPRLQALATPLIEAHTAKQQGEATRGFIRALLNEERRYLVLLCEFWGYAAREARIRRRFARVRRNRRAAIEEMIERRVGRRGTRLRLGPPALAAGFLALAIGVLFEALTDPQLDAEELHASMFTLVSEGAVERAA